VKGSVSVVGVDRALYDWHEDGQVARIALPSIASKRTIRTDTKLVKAVSCSLKIIQQRLLRPSKCLERCVKC
jgi:hypothetical protein